MSVWVVNASPIISLARLGLADLQLEIPSQTFIPLAVFKEVTLRHTEDQGGVWVKKTRRRRPEIFITPSLTPSSIDVWDLGKGETSVLRLCLANPGHNAILDDGPTSNAASVLGIPVVGSLGVLIEAKRGGWVKEITPYIEQLVANGFRVSPKILVKVLALAEE